MFDSYMVLFIITNLSFLKYFSKDYKVAKVLNIVYLLLIILQNKGEIDLKLIIFLNTVTIFIYELSRTEEIIRRYCSLLNQVKIFIFKLFFEYYNVEYIVICFIITQLIDNNLHIYMIIISLFFAQLIWRSNFEVKNFINALKEFEITEIQFQDFISSLDTSSEFQNAISFYEMLCFQEDKDFIQSSKLINKKRTMRFLKSIFNSNKTYNLKKYKRGYGTIPGQITRCLFLNTGYSTKTRKIYELVFAAIHFSTIENYLLTMSKGVKTESENLDKYVRYFYLHIYYTNIKSSGSIGRKTFEEIFGHKYYQGNDDEILIFLSTLYGDSPKKDNYYFSYYKKEYLSKSKIQLINWK